MIDFTNVIIYEESGEDTQIFVTLFPFEKVMKQVQKSSSFHFETSNFVFGALPSRRVFAERNGGL